MADRVLFVCTLILAGAYLYATEQLPSLEIGDPLGPKAFPRLLAAGLLITAGVLLLEMLRARRKAPAAPAQPRDPRDRGAQLVVAAAAMWTLLYFLVFETFGYVLATAVYLLALMACFNQGRWTANVLTAVLFGAGSYLVFSRLLGVNLPRGILPF